ncbi:D-alanyl-D-alanine carboxypeptidase family protein [Agromyces aurantiacus]|uniref:D-alanyl-D-alanine carboxypeptidase family protein n=1 Tax=Agromyces aurantiacus TaxID=165814 RepID=A0ABV9R9A7_9MICO|nr:D-alanyl-D-alanine carboxypeptidase [Agromyces aurantiacus]MBM7504788.1 D-alanyl-D-alanine carboxypeptidase (penicillin-binding protein 5/6) [Agromyces aurantiacus]
MARTPAPAPPAPAALTADRSPRPSARVYRRRRFVVFGTLGMLLAGLVGGGAYATTTLGAPVPAAAPAVIDPAPLAAAPQVVDQPDFGAWAVGAVGFDGTLAAGNEASSMPIASIAKVVTSLVLLEQHPIPAGEGGPDIRYTDADVAIYWDMVAQNGSVAPVVPGSTLSLKESLEAMLLPSGNNYANSLAVWGFGSVDAYVERANAWADEHGLSTLRIADPSGLSLENTASATDLVRLGQLALEEPTLADIVATKQVDIPELGTLKNSNKLLGTHGVDGIKTGTTDDAANLLFSADVAVGSSSVTIVGVLLGGANHPAVRQAIAEMIDTIAPGFHEVVAVKAGTELATYSTPWGDTASARTSESASVVVWSDTPVDVSVDAEPIRLAQDGSDVGTAVVTAGTQRIEVPLVLDGTVDDPGTWWRLTNPGGLD